MGYFSVMSREQFEESFPEIHQQVCDDLGMGFVPNIFRCVVVESPELALASWVMVRNNLCSGSIPRITKELMFSYIAHRRKCHYCDIAHQALALHHGCSGEDVVQILKGVHEIGNPTLRAVIEFSDLCVDNQFSEITQFYDKLARFGFSKNEVFELMGMVSCSMYMVNMADCLAVEIDTLFVDTVEKAINKAM